MRRLQLEICVESIADARAALSGGADRLEVCARLDLDGLTPDLELVRKIRQATSLPLMAMIRPRPGDFVYSLSELAEMAGAIESLLAAGADGFVFGCLRAERSVDVEGCRALLARCANRPAVFHRAFDQIADRTVALEQLIELGFNRVLTSGGARCAADSSGLAEIRRMILQARGRIEILPGGGIRPENVAAVIRATGCNQIHSSARVGATIAVNADCVADLRHILDTAISAA